MKKIILFFALFFAASGICGAEKRLEWPDLKTDLPFDETIKTSQLKNGFRYMIKKNTTPENRAAVYLGIMSGSIYEEDHERGIAHFLEHMVFNGSKNFEPGELVKYFQKIGMDFGADTNAHTGFDETVYKIYLPEGKQKDLKDAFTVLKDFAVNATISQKEVDKERKVILSEMSARDSASYRTRVKLYNFLFDGLIFPDRFPIGTKEVVKNADSELIKQFYNDFYVPERMVLAVTGDINTEKTDELIKEFFSDIEKSSKEKNIPDFGSLKHKKGIKTFSHHEKEAGSTEVSVSYIKDIAFETSDFEYEAKWLKRYMASQIINYRLSALLETGDASYEFARSFSFPFMKKVMWSHLNAETAPEDWDKTLETVLVELKKISLYGFKNSEVQRAKNEILKMLEKKAESADTRDTKSLASQMIRNAMNGDTIVSPGNEKKIFSPFVKNLDKSDLDKAFKEIWNLNNLSVAVTGNFSPDKNMKKLVKEKTETVLSGKVYKDDDKNQKSFPYLDPFKKETEIKKEKEFKNPDLKRIVLNNNICVNFKKTDFKKDQVVFKASFGKGSAYEPKDKKGISFLTQQVINIGKLGSLSADDLKSYLSDKNASLNFGIGKYSFYLKGSSSKEDLEELFQLFYHYINDPGIKKYAYDLALKRIKSSYEQKKKSVDGTVSLEAPVFFSENDHRFGMPSYEEAKKISIKDVRQYALENFNVENMEISIVGDFEEDDVRPFALKYLSFEKNNNPDEVKPESPDFPKGKEKRIKVDTKIKSAFVLAGIHTTDISPIENSRLLNICSELIKERLRIGIRENLGISYSPFAYHNPSRVYEGYGGLFAGVKTTPEYTEQVKKEILKIASDLQKKGITEDEFQRALRPLVNSVKTQVQKNSYWLETVLDGSYKNPEQLKWADTIVKGYSSATKKSVEEKLKKYLIPEKFSFLIVESK
jgi:zinc protease